MNREYSTNISYKEYLKNYLLAYSVSIILLIAVILRILTSDWSIKLELAIGLLIGYPFLLLIASIFHHRKQLQIKYVFSDDAITVINNSEELKYKLSQIRDVIQPSKEDYKKTGIDYIRIKFDDGNKITFGNTLPYYADLKTFLKSYSKTRFSEDNLIV